MGAESGPSAPVLTVGRQSQVDNVLRKSERSGIRLHDRVRQVGTKLVRRVGEGVVSVRAVASVVLVGLLTGGGVASASVGLARDAPKARAAAFAGTWEQHESTLVIAKTGNGRMNYADLTRCPSCSFGSAPRGTLSFVLTSITKRQGAGHVTKTSDSKVYTKGESVRVRLAAASPGEFLVLSIGRKLVTYFCNQSSAGQCGACCGAGRGMRDCAALRGR